MKPIFNSTLLLLLLLVSVARAQSDIQMTEVLFAESEPGLEPYQSRYLLSEQFLRLDDGTDQGDFVLFDRQSREIHSFNHEDGTHLLIKPQHSETLDFKLDFQVLKKELTQAPKINGILPVEHQYFADSRLCKQSVNVKGLLVDMTQVLIDYEQVLVEQTKTTLSRFPGSIRTACYMANNYLHASDYLFAGFPLHVKDDSGREKRLLSFQQVLKPRSMLQFPQGYRVYHSN